MAQSSFDIVSEYDKAEVIHAFDQTQREIGNRYDFKGSSARIDWLDSDKTGIKITGDSQYHLDAIVEVFRKKLASRGQSLKTLDTSAEPIISNLKTTWNVTFKQGLDKEKTKKITKLMRDELPKIKTQIQGESVRLTSPKKDQLQEAMELLRKQDFDFPIIFNNFR